MTTFPIRNWNGDLPKSYVDPGGFGTIRKHDVHTGIDIYCNHGTPVYAMKSGVVEASFMFTGNSVGSPWWNDTNAVVVRSRNRDDEWLLYGELSTCSPVGTIIHEGDVIGYVSTVLKKDKGKPMSMLHFEVYNKWKPWYDGAVWELGKEKPPELEDPYTLLEKC